MVYILNKYYAVCGEIIEKNGGRLDKFIGDGIMAIFDAESKTDVNSRNAVISANEISKSMKTLNSELKTDFSEDMRFGMGIHAGSMIVGMMGYGKTVTETAVGDNVNIAARLEALSQPNGITVSKSIFDLVKSKTNFEYNGEFFVFIAYDRVLDDDEMLQLHNAFKDRYGL